MIAKMLNGANGDGSVYSYTIVYFQDGSDPTAAPHNLPYLASAAVVDALPMAIAGRYLTGYGVKPLPRTLAARRRSLKSCIGCKVQ